MSKLILTACVMLAITIYSWTSWLLPLLPIIIGLENGVTSSLNVSSSSEIDKNLDLVDFCDYFCRVARNNTPFYS